MAGFPCPDAMTGVLRVNSSLFLLPTLHQTLEFAVLVRQVFHLVRPDAVALELPRTIEPAFRKALTRLPFLTVILYPEGPDMVYLLVEPHEAMVEAGRLALENGCELHLIDRDDGSYPLHRDSAPDAWALTQVPPGVFVEAILESSPPSKDTRDIMRDRTMAFHLNKLTASGKRVLWTGGAAHARGILAALEEPQAQPFGRIHRPEVQIAALSEKSSREVMSDIPYVIASFERARSSGSAFSFDSETDSQKVLDSLLHEAASRYEKDQRTTIPRRSFDVLKTFSRNLALIEGVLTPAFYELVTAARGAVDDDYAWHVFDLGAQWPWPDTSHSLPVIDLRGEDLYLDGRKVQFVRRFPNKGARLRRLPVRKRPREKNKGDWARVKFGQGICSHPPEDIRIETFGNRMRFQAMHRLSEESRRVFPMTASLHDGLDIRESLRRLHENRLYVYEEPRIRGGVSSVVVIFDEDFESYPWRMTWMGEHGQESDMAFYATSMQEELAGPGISRSRYGGFLMTMPPGRLYDVWSDPDYSTLERAQDVLLLAALDYALEPRVVYVAKEPPARYMKRFAARLGKQIVYIPIGTLPRERVLKLRQFHILANKLVRSYAQDYIGD